MKKYFALAVLVGLFFANCAPQRTCPTYLKNTNKIENKRRV
jgi:hypothetical protein